MDMRDVLGLVCVVVNALHSEKNVPLILQIIMCNHRPTKKLNEYFFQCGTRQRLGGLLIGSDNVTRAQNLDNGKCARREIIYLNDAIYLGLSSDYSLYNPQVNRNKYVLVV